MRAKSGWRTIRRRGAGSRVPPTHQAPGVPQMLTSVQADARRVHAGQRSRRNRTGTGRGTAVEAHAPGNTGGCHVGVAGVGVVNGALSGCGHGEYAGPVTVVGWRDATAVEPEA